MNAYGVIILAVVAMATVKAADICESYANGCSTPFHMPLVYKTLFTPSCNKHDVCYRCGSLVGITRDQCDEAFLHNMEAACAVHDAARKRHAPHALEKRSACTTIAHTFYYEGVHLLGGLFYRDPDETEAFCSEANARTCLGL